MRKLVAYCNITLDGFCDHTAMIADAEIHQHVNEILKDADILLFGRKTYQLMESSWIPIVKEPTGVKSVDEFAIFIHNLPKVVFSNTLQNTEWKNTRIVSGNIKDEVIQLKHQPGKNILAGGPSLIVALLQMGLIDEFQLCIHPVLIGSGQPFFEGIKKNMRVRLIKTHAFSSGAILVYYEPIKKWND